ncbi:MAG: trypsin-like peptidase domain-containing protein [Planctomycetota bacterium JB042]
MIRLECPKCAAQHLVHERRASRGIECRCGTALGADAVAEGRPSLRDLRPDLPAPVPVAVPRAADRTPLVVGAAVVLLIAGWLGLVAYQNRARAGTPGALVDPNDGPDLRAVLPRGGAGFEIAERGADRPRFAVLRHGTGALVSPDGRVLTNCHLIRDIARLQNIANDDSTFEWFARKVILERYAAAIRAELRRAPRTAGFGGDPIDRAGLEATLRAVEAEDPSLIQRCTTELRATFLALEPKLWLLCDGRPEPIEAKPVFVPDGDAWDVAILGCGVRFERFLRLRRTRDAAGATVRALGRPGTADAPPSGVEPLERLVARHAHLRDGFADLGARLTVTHGELRRFRRSEAHDGTRLATVEHGAALAPDGRGGLLLDDDDAAVVGIVALLGEDRATLSVPDLFHTLSPYLPAISWAE